MGSRVSLKVGSLSLTVVGDDAMAKALPAKLREAFVLLANRLDAAPAGRCIAAERLLLDRIELEPLALDELVGPRGSERLAESLYRRIVG
jgi:hypothetical protein